MSASFRPYREESRKNWGATLEEGTALTLEQINTGALLRIADALEKAADRLSAMSQRGNCVDAENRRLKAKAARLQKKCRALELARVEEAVDKMTKKP